MCVRFVYIKRYLFSVLPQSRFLKQIFFQIALIKQLRMKGSQGKNVRDYDTELF